MYLDDVALMVSPKREEVCSLLAARGIGGWDVVEGEVGEGQQRREEESEERRFRMGEAEGYEKNQEQRREFGRVLSVKNRRRRK
ncbi:hypothetical protein KFK09_008744 [Dendrobium nobile]|uniref:Uncharacterized protein n=1 Tax=Dendrobium nobile TaxID=94219 RepID=A0A8T3BPW9_DENNO|nr:hypothetical protein KFK09_008744 [Dendrobium nobile]